MMIMIMETNFGARNLGVICEQKFKDKGISNRGLDLKINTLIHKILFVYMHPMFNNLFYCIV